MLPVQKRASALQSRFIDWWVSEKDSGQGEAINKGLARATGEIVAWLNSDDYYLPDAVSSAVRILQQNPDVSLVYGDMLAVDENGQTFNLLKYRQLSLEDLLYFQIIGQPAVFFRREALKELADWIPRSTLCLTITSGSALRSMDGSCIFRRPGPRHAITRKRRTD